MDQSSNWVFTLNNYTEQEVADISTWVNKGARGIGYSKEVGESGTPHLQGFICMTKKCGLKKIKALNNRMHIEVMRGKIKDSEKYCSKQASLSIIGDMPTEKAPKSKVQEQMWDEVKSGSITEAELLQKYGGHYGRYYKAVGHCLRLAKKPKTYQRIERPANAIWFGPAGSGKTWAAEEFAIQAEHSMWKMPVSQLKSNWYDGYNGEDIILYDDFRGSCIQPQEFLNLLDGMKQFPIKGGFVENKSKYLFFTSPDHPINWWPNWYAKDENNWAQVKRRLDKIYQMDTHKGIETDVDSSQLYKHFIPIVSVK